MEFLPSTAENLLKLVLGNSQLWQPLLYCLSIV